MRPRPTRIPSRLTADLAGGTSIGAGLGMITYAILSMLAVDPSISLGLGILLTLAGFRSLVWGETLKISSGRALLGSFVRMSPVAWGGMVVGFAISMAPPYFVYPELVKLWHMGIASAAAVPHMLLYLNPGSRAEEIAGPTPTQEMESTLLGNDVIEELERRLGQTVTEAGKLISLRTLLKESRSRLADEISSLGRRGNLNLAIGIFATGAAILLLAYVVAGATDDFRDMTSILSYYIPRLSFVIFVEIFAFFFLRLYKTSLDGIKYFQNELTGVELKFVALEAALLDTSSEPLVSLLPELARAERNFILKPGETTAELKKFELEGAMYREILKPLVQGLASKSK